jgi:hypothetical protein
VPATLTLLELAVQGVAGLQESGRFTLRPGLNALGGTDRASQAFLQTLEALLFADGPQLSGGPGAKAALTFLAGDGQTYRLVGVGNGSRAMSRLDSTAGRFVPQPADPPAAKLLRDLGLPERRLFEQLFLLSGPLPVAPVPVERPAELRAASPGIESRFAELVDQMGANKPSTPAAIRERLTQVEKEDSDAAEIESLQFQLDGLQQQLFQAEDALKGLEGLEAEVKRLDADLASLPDVGDEKLALIKRLPNLAQKREEALKRLTEERITLEQHKDVGSLAGLTKHRLFVASLIVGAAAIAVAVAGSTLVPAIRFIALLDIPAFGISAVVVVRRLSEMRQHEGVGRKLALLAEREGRIQKTFAVEAREATSLMKSLNLDDISAAEEAVGRRAAVAKRRDDARTKLERAQAEDAAAGRRTLRDRVRAEVTDFEEKLTAFGGYRRDRAEIRRELDSLRAELSKLTGGALGDMELSLDDSRAADEAAALFRQAAELFAMTPGMLLTTVKDRASQLVFGLTDKRCGAIGFAPDGQVTLQRSGEASLLFSGLAPKDKGLVLLAARLAFAERYLASHHLFVFIDEKNAGLDELRGQLVLKLLKGLSRSAQVLWTGQTAVPIADQRVQLG